MAKKKSHRKQRLHPPNKIRVKEDLKTNSGSIPLNTANLDRISFSFLINEKRMIRKIENISYEILVDDKWEWVVRYDDHGGDGNLHRHVRITLGDNSDIPSEAGIKKYKNKNLARTWVFNEIRRNHIFFRKKLLKNSGRKELY